MKTIAFSQSTTFRSEQLGRYFSDVNRYKVMSNDDVIKALAEGRTDDVINANLKLVVSIAKGYQNRGLELDDLIQEGNIGLMIAVTKYDHTRETAFTTCALEWIRKYITMALTDKSRMVRLPKHKAKDAVNITLSMDAPLGSDEDGNDKCLLDTFASDACSDNISDAEDAKYKIQVLMEGLNKRDRQMIAKMFGIGYPMEFSNYQLSVEYGCTEERIRQLRFEIISKMQAML